MAPCRVSSLYVHVPFCARKCDYCAFYSEPCTGELVNRYIAALNCELELIASELQPKTMFFGGGTPSLLNLNQWKLILRRMERLDLLGASEWTIECNPATVSLDKARLLRDFGVNRISMGVQSLDPSLLDQLGRVHSREMAFKSYDILRRAGFENVNLDLMFAIPGQSLASWRQTLQEAVAMGSEHLSAYEVIYEEDTALYKQLQAGAVALDEDLACAMYDELVETVVTSGFEQYEIANFARRRQNVVAPGSDARVPALACRHNVNYWRGGSFFGLGPSAAGYVRGERTKNWSNTRLYCEQLEQGRRAIESRERLSPLARAGEIAAFGLRMTRGWSFSEFRAVTQFDLRDHWQTPMSHLVEQGWGLLSQDRFRLTPKGLRFADSVAQLFLE